MRLRRLTIALIPLLASGAYAAKDSCFECHSVMEGMSVVYKDDVHYHNAIGCADCHGGDPKEDDQNVSMSAERGFKVRGTRQDTPEYCGRCHVHPLAAYRASVHGKRLAASHSEGAECVDCHSVHNIRAAGDPLSPAHPRHVTETCAKCHAATADLFRKSPHGPVFISRQMAGCTVCHASHGTEPASRALLTGKNSVCARCHAAESAGGKAAAEIARLVGSLETAGPGSNEVLARVRRAVHSFDVAAVRRAAEPAVAGR